MNQGESQELFIKKASFHYAYTAICDNMHPLLYD